MGLGRVKKVLWAFLKSPYPKAFLFIGPPGTGKTSTARVIERSLKLGYPTRLASEQANYERIRQFAEDCQYATDVHNPEAKFAYLRIDEIDAATPTAQRLLLPVLDDNKNASSCSPLIQQNPKSH